MRTLFSTTVAKENTGLLLNDNNIHVLRI